MVSRAMSVVSRGPILRTWLPLVLTTCAAALGCAQVIGLDKDYREVADPGGGQDAGCPEPTGGTMAPPPSCPSASADVAPMKGLPGGYCIDTTEVTWGQYKAWLAKPPAASSDAACSWNTSFEPKDLQPIDPNADDLPVAGVDWCDAFEYCKQNGKRLCGAIGSSSGVAFDACDYQDYTKDQWHNACSAGGTQAYTWGNDVKDKSCNGGNNQKTSAVPVASMPLCMSSVLAYNDVFDLTGNVMEWEDSCDGETGAGDRCRARGGSFQSSDVQARCDHDYPLQRDSRFSYLGFRCCTD